MSKEDLRLIIQKLSNYPESLTEPEESSVRKASVAAIIRWRPYVDCSMADHSIKTPLDLLNEPWVNDCHGEAEILYIQRALRPNDVWSGHIAFPGGKDEPSDMTGLDTVIRECKEEIGIDLSTDQFMLLGTLEKRRINQANMLKMVLTPYVFLQVTPTTPACTIQTSEVAKLHWTPIRYLLSTALIPYKPVKEDPDGKSPWPIHTIVPAIRIADTYLWGMTLRMTQDILHLPISPYVLPSSQL
ncbi:NUDIX hydrolase domain-like protein [Blakeslea trispora]|nr:NUDIX hydrolase domain-like protein [Blakeslea trispora]